MLKRYIVEMGIGVDLHGGNITKAAIKGVKEATSKSCLCGVEDILGLPPEKMHVHVKIGTTQPDQVDVEAVKKAVPVGTAEVEVVQGGLEADGLKVKAFGEGSTIQIVVVALTVWVEVP